MIIQLPESETQEVHQVIEEEDDLYHYTTTGWRLVAVVQEEVVVTVDDEEVRPEHLCQTSYYAGDAEHIKCRQSFTRTVTKYVVTKRSEDVLEGMTERVREAEQKAKETQTDMGDAQARVFKLEERVTQLEGALTNERTARDVILREKDEALKSLRKMERDIAKVRKAVGNLRMDDILGVKV
jgi:Mg2+ and Co2+ transporter CorA